MGQKKVQVPLGDTASPLKDSPPPIKFHKSSAPSKYTTSKFSSTSNFRGFISCVNTPKTKLDKKILIVVACSCCLNKV